MNSKYMLVDTETMPLSVQLSWWKYNKEIYLYPKMWDNLQEYDKLYLGLDENKVITKDKLEEKLTELTIQEKGVIIISYNNTENKNMFRKLVKKIDKANPNTNNKICFGDYLLYDTPLASLDDPTTTWYCNDGEDVEEVYEAFCEKYV